MTRSFTSWSSASKSCASVASPPRGKADVGATTFPPQLEVVERHVADAVAKGARVLTGGWRAAGPGLYYEPTVLVDVDHGMDCMREETFGPTLPVMKVRDADEAVRLANDSKYGLSSSVYTKDVRKGEAIARRLTAGNTAVNDGYVHVVSWEAPFGGSRDSGVGARNGREGILKYTRMTKLLERALSRYYGRQSLCASCECRSIRWGRSRANLAHARSFAFRLLP